MNIDAEVVTAAIAVGGMFIGAGAWYVHATVKAQISDLFEKLNGRYMRRDVLEPRLTSIEKKLDKINIR